MYNMSLDRLVKYKGLDAGAKLIDRMGKAELAAHLFRITQTAEKTANENIRGHPRSTFSGRPPTRPERKMGDYCCQEGGLRQVWRLQRQWEPPDVACFQGVSRGHPKRMRTV